MAVPIAMMDNSSTNTTVYISDAMQAPYELVRSDRFEQLIRRMKFADSYITNSKRESSCLLFVETFRSQYSQLFPSRPQLLLSPLNECNTQKFISTFVRPTQLKYEELYDATTENSSTSGANNNQNSSVIGSNQLHQTLTSTQRSNAMNNTVTSASSSSPFNKKQLQKMESEKGIAKFLANFVVYEPLEENDRVPTKIVSPATVLEWQVANSIELSITLCSLLCGTGYNAYVVIGRATREVVECDRTQSSWDGSLPDENNSDDDEPPAEPRNNRFWQVMKHRPKFESEFDKKMDEAGVQNELYMMSKKHGNYNPASTLTMTLGGTTGGSHGSGYHGSGDALDITSGGNYGSSGDHDPSGLNSSAYNDNNNEDDDGNDSNEDEDGGNNASGSARTISPLVHAWVVILPGGVQSKKRPTEQIICIEPSTGNTFEINDSRYHAVETVFNHMNCFVNMNPSCRPRDLNWDMYNLEEWESVFLTDFEIDNTSRRDKDSSSASGGGGGNTTRSGGNKSERNNNNASMNASTTFGGGADGENPLADLSAAIANASWAPNDGGDLSLDLPASWVNPLTISPAQLANRYPTRATGVQFADARVTRFAEYADPQLRVLEVRVPDDVDPRLEQVHTFYRHRHDLLRRKSEYPSLNNKVGSDPLEDPRKIHQWFLPGRKPEKETRVEGLRELIFEAGKQRIMRFYWRSRDDGLAKRIELWNEGDRSAHPLPRKIIEEYKGRESTDCLTYRSATFKNAPHQLGYPGMGNAAGSSSMMQGNNTSNSAGESGGYPRHGSMAEAAIAAGGRNTSLTSGGGASSSTGTERDSISSRPPERMAEKYCRNPKIPAEDDIAKIKFLKPLSSEGEIWVHYHYPKDCITFPYRQFPKAVERDRADSGSGVGSQSSFSDPSTAPLVVTAPFQPKPREPELREQLRRLLSREKDCLNEIRTKNDEAAFIINARNHDVRSLKPIISAYNTLRKRSNETDKDKEEKRLEDLRRAQSRNDYLAPYIAALDLERNLRGADLSSVRLSVENAKIVRDSALKDLKDRLIQRGHIMQARLDQEKEELYRRQAAFQKNLDASNEGAADSEAFAKYCSDAAWRMKILDERLSRHIEDAGNRYAALARKLSEDARLAALYEGH